MYTLYFSPDACSLATQVVLRELEQPLRLINKQQIERFTDINPAGAVPVLQDGEQRIREGAAILLHLLDKHPSTLMPAAGESRQQAIQNMLFANATVHPAYGRLFFLAGADVADQARLALMQQAADDVSRLWAVVEHQLEGRTFLGGEMLSVADILLTVYARWNSVFPVSITVGDRTQAMFQRVLARPSFQRSLVEEKQLQAA